MPCESVLIIDVHSLYAVEYFGILAVKTVWTSVSEQAGDFVLKELLEGYSKGELVDFIIKHAANNSDFANAVDVRFREPKFYAELNKIGGKVDHALEGASDYRRHDSWGYIDFSVEDIVTEINQRAEQGHINTKH